MLKLFEVSGFKNFSSKITFDFSDVSDYKFNTSCIENNTICKAIVYGKNSIGKSNLGLAIFDIVSNLTDKNVSPRMYDYYLTAGNVNEYAEFRYVFQFGDSTIDYIYRKKAEKTIVYEKVSLNGEELYECNLKKINIKALSKIAPTLNVSPDLESRSYLKYVINNVPLSKNHPLQLLMEYVSHMLWFRNLDENRYIGYKNNATDYFTFIADGKLSDEFQSLLIKAGISDEITVIKDTDGRDQLYLNTNPPIPYLRVASSGTKALYNFFYWYKTAPDASMIFIDEFDAYYHYELSETIIMLLEQIKGVQIVLTSHNTNLLSNRIMRPDCYFILTKNRITSLKNATDRELREGHNLEKLYISGEFGEK